MKDSSDVDQIIIDDLTPNIDPEIAKEIINRMCKIMCDRGILYFYKQVIHSWDDTLKIIDLED